MNIINNLSVDKTICLHDIYFKMINKKVESILAELELIFKRSLAYFSAICYT